MWAIYLFTYSIFIYISNRFSGVTRATYLLASRRLPCFRHASTNGCKMFVIIINNYNYYRINKKHGTHYSTLSWLRTHHVAYWGLFLLRKFFKLIIFSDNCQPTHFSPPESIHIDMKHKFFRLNYPSQLVRQFEFLTKLICNFLLPALNALENKRLWDKCLAIGLGLQIFTS